MKRVVGLVSGTLQDAGSVGGLLGHHRYPGPNQGGNRIWADNFFPTYDASGDISECIGVTKPVVKLSPATKPPILKVSATDRKGKLRNFSGYPPPVVAETKIDPDTEVDTYINNDPDAPPNAKPSRRSGKERSTEAPSWAKCQQPAAGESCADFAERILNEKYGVGKWEKGAGSEHNKIKK